MPPWACKLDLCLAGGFLQLAQAGTYQACQPRESVTCRSQVECYLSLAAASGRSLTPPTTHGMPACRIAKLGELNTVSEGVPVEYGNAGGCL